MSRSVSGAPLTVTMWAGPVEPECIEAMQDMRLRADEK
jgi:hypothetical protein